MEVPIWSILYMTITLPVAAVAPFTGKFINLSEEKACYKMVYYTLYLGLSQSSEIALES